MVTKRRTIESETERYGSFDMDSSFYPDGRFSYHQPEVETYDIMELVKRFEDVPEVPPLRSSQNIHEAARHHRSEESVMPKITARQSVSARPKAAREDRGIPTSLLWYLVAVVVIAVAVIATGIALSSVLGSVDAAEYRHNELVQDVGNARESLAVVESEDTMRALAYEQGMVSIDNPYTIMLISVQDQTEYATVSTNLFDRLVRRITGQ